MNDRRIAIRCCCDAGLVLGTVPAPPSVVEKQMLCFDLLNGEQLDLPIEIACGPIMIGRPSGDYEEEVPVLKSVSVFHRARELAIKSNDTPLETLRLIPGFEEINRQIPVGKLEFSPASAE